MLFALPASARQGRYDNFFLSSGTPADFRVITKTALEKEYKGKQIEELFPGETVHIVDDFALEHVAYTVSIVRSCDDDPIESTIVINVPTWLWTYSPFIESDLAAALNLPSVPLTRQEASRLRRSQSAILNYARTDELLDWVALALEEVAKEREREEDDKDHADDKGTSLDEKADNYERLISDFVMVESLQPVRPVNNPLWGQPKNPDIAGSSHPRETSKDSVQNSLEFSDSSDDQNEIIANEPTLEIVSKDQFIINDCDLQNEKVIQVSRNTLSPQSTQDKAVQTEENTYNDTYSPLLTVDDLPVDYVGSIPHSEQLEESNFVDINISRLPTELSVVDTHNMSIFPDPKPIVTNPSEDKQVLTNIASRKSVTNNIEAFIKEYKQTYDELISRSADDDIAKQLSEDKETFIAQFHNSGTHKEIADNIGYWRGFLDRECYINNDAENISPNKRQATHHAWSSVDSLPSLWSPRERMSLFSPSKKSHRTVNSLFNNGQFLQPPNGNWSDTEVLESKIAAAIDGLKDAKQKDLCHAQLANIKAEEFDVDEQADKLEKCNAILSEMQTSATVRNFNLYLQGAVTHGIEIAKEIPAYSHLLLYLQIMQKLMLEAEPGIPEISDEEKLRLDELDDAQEELKKAREELNDAVSEKEKVALQIEQQMNLLNSLTAQQNEFQDHRRKELETANKQLESLTNQSTKIAADINVLEKKYNTYLTALSQVDNEYSEEKNRIEIEMNKNRTLSMEIERVLLRTKQELNEKMQEKELIDSAIMEQKEVFEKIKSDTIVVQAALSDLIKKYQEADMAIRNKLNDKYKPLLMEIQINQYSDFHGMVEMLKSFARINEIKDFEMILEEQKDELKRQAKKLDKSTFRTNAATLIRLALGDKVRIKHQRALSLKLPPL